MVQGDWQRKPRSHFPALQEALFAVLWRWAAAVGINPARRAKKYAAVDQAAKELFEMALKLRQKSSRELWVRSRSDWSGKWAAAVGSRLRRVVQEVLQSPTTVEYFDPAETVVILGAGASRHAGLPLADSMLDIILGELKRDAPDIHRNLSDDPRFADLKTSGGFEELFSRIELIDWAAKAWRGPLPIQEKSYRSRLLHAYRRVILDRQYSRVGREVTCSFLEQLDSFSKGKWAIISFNQDTVVETELREIRRNGEPIWDEETGFGAIAHRLNGAVTSADVYQPLPARRVYKPHGSVALGRDYAWPLRGLGVWTKAFERSVNGSVYIPGAEEEALAPMILPPSFLKVYEDDFVSNMIARITYEIINARHIVVAGFRLRPDDSVVSNIIRLAIKLNVAGQSGKVGEFSLVGPDADSVVAGSLGMAWADVMTFLGNSGWAINRYSERFEEYVSAKRLAP